MRIVGLIAFDLITLKNQLNQKQLNEILHKEKAPA